jgi:NAD(P)-dependent dehydrogenase (short-subunit alcohol dehydrogenase family)
MSIAANIVVIGGTSGIGRRTAEAFADLGNEVVITSRSHSRAKVISDEIGGHTHGIGLDLSCPDQIADKLSGVTNVKRLVLCAIERDRNTVREYDLDSAMRLVTLKLVGYTAVVHALRPRMDEDSSAVLLGGLAMVRPYPGSTTVTTVNGGISALVKTLAVELAPIRFNALHPAMVGDSPYWSDKPQAIDAARARTPTGRLATSDDIVAAIVFLLENKAVNGIDLNVDGGALLR